jgi:hypothetical protein
MTGTHIFEQHSSLHGACFCSAHGRHTLHGTARPFLTPQLDN